MAMYSARATSLAVYKIFNVLGVYYMAQDLIFWSSLCTALTRRPSVVHFFYAVDDVLERTVNCLSPIVILGDIKLHQYPRILVLAWTRIPKGINNDPTFVDLH